MISIYVNTRKISIVSDLSDFNLSNTKKNNSFQINDIFTLKNVTKSFLDREINTEELYLEGDPTTIYNDFIQLYPQIDAAGGAVFNPEQKLLMIFRRNYWDLPKGKTEAGESAEISAKREVEEETGINNPGIVKTLPATFHMYQLDNQWVTKKTQWFLMKANTQSLNPQTEEDIELVQWVDRENLNPKIKQTFDSLKPLIEVAINEVENGKLSSG